MQFKSDKGQTQLQWQHLRFLSDIDKRSHEDRRGNTTARSLTRGGFDLAVIWCVILVFLL